MTLKDLLLSKASAVGGILNDFGQQRFGLSQDILGMNQDMFNTGLDFSKDQFNANLGFNKFMWQKGIDANKTSFLGRLGSNLLNVGVPIAAGYLLKNQLEKSADAQTGNLQDFLSQYQQFVGGLFPTNNNLNLNPFGQSVFGQPSLPIPQINNPFIANPSILGRR
jgi:hypothetical protein